MIIGYWNRKIQLSLKQEASQ